MNKIDLIIDALENCKGLTQIDRAHLKKALAAARELRALKPVAYADALDLAKDCNWDTFICQHSSENHEGTRFKIPLYTAPPRTEWVGLTDEEMLEIWRQHGSYEMLFKKVEIKLKDKNTT